MLPAIVARTSDLLEFSMGAQTLGQRIALGLYSMLSMADHIARRKLHLPWGLPHSLLTDVSVNTTWGSFHCRNRTSDGWIAGPLFEPSTRTYLKTVTTGGVFVDVGSHIGRYTIEMARHLRGNGRVVALEPHPDTFRALKGNIELNGLSNVVALNVGCWSSSGMLPLVGKDDLARISSESSSEKHLVRVVTLDELVDQLQLSEVTTLKIDAEGAEEQVLAGASRLISMNPSLRIVFEALDDSALSRISRLLTPSGFTIERLSWKNFVASRLPGNN